MKTSLSLHGAVLTGGYSAPGPALIPPPNPLVMSLCGWVI